MVAVGDAGLRKQVRGAPDCRSATTTARTQTLTIYVKMGILALIIQADGIQREYFRRMYLYLETYSYGLTGSSILEIGLATKLSSMIRVWHETTISLHFSDRICIKSDLLDMNQNLQNINSYPDLINLVRDSPTTAVTPRYCFIPDRACSGQM